MALPLFAPSAAAVTGDSITPVGDVIRPMFTQVVWVSLVIGIFVWGLLIVALIKFRRRPDGPQEGPQIHGNNKLEIAWTIAPALVMSWLLVISYNGLMAMEGPDRPEPEFVITAIGSQFRWEFVYPDGERVADAFRVEEGRVVGLDVVSTDVIHAIRIQDLDVMVDAVPGRTNYAWFLAREPGVYRVACFQFCGFAHGEMVAEVEVFAAGTQETPWGEPPAPEPEEAPDEAEPTPAETPETSGNETAEADAVVDVTMRNFQFLHPEAEPFRVETGQVVEFQLVNEDAVVHNMYLGTYGATADDRQVLFHSTDLLGGESGSFVVTFPAEEGVWDVWCNIPGHAAQGMITAVGIGMDAQAPTGVGENPRLPGPSGPVVLLFLGLAALGVSAWRRQR